MKSGTDTKSWSHAQDRDKTETGGLGQDLNRTAMTI